SQPEVTEILLAVSCLLHGTQHDRRQQFLLGPALHLFEQLLDLLWCRASLPLQSQSEAADELTQLLDARRVGWLVNAIRDRQLPPGRLASHRLVREQHEILDQAVRLEPQHALDIRRLAAFLERDARRGHVEVDAAAVLARRTQREPQRVQHSQRLVRLGIDRARAVEYGLRVVVGELVPAANDTA